MLLDEDSQAKYLVNLLIEQTPDLDEILSSYAEIDRTSDLPTLFR
jgi:hypothetical protein